MLGSAAGGTTTFLVCLDGSSHPAFVVKLARDGSVDRLRLEAAAIATITAAGSALARSVPQVLLNDAIDGRPFLALTPVRGRPRPPRRGSEGLPDPRDAARAFDRISRWLADLYHGTAVAATAEDRARHAAALELLRRSVTLDAPAMALLDDIAAALPAILGSRLPLEHGDLTWHNVLVDGAGVAVVDWTDARERGAPLGDLLTFITTYMHHTRRGAGLRSFVDAFEGAYLRRGRYARTVAQALTEHAAKVGLERDLLPLSLGLFLAERVALELERGQTPAPRIAEFLARGADGDREARAQPWLEYLRTLARRHGEVFRA